MTMGTPNFSNRMIVMIKTVTIFHVSNDKPRYNWLITKT